MASLGKEVFDYPGVTGGIFSIHPCGPWWWGALEPWSKLVHNANTGWRDGWFGWVLSNIFNLKSNELSPIQILFFIWTPLILEVWLLVWLSWLKLVIRFILVNHSVYCEKKTGVSPLVVLFVSLKVSQMFTPRNLWALLSGSQALAVDTLTLSSHSELQTRRNVKILSSVRLVSVASVVLRCCNREKPTNTNHITILLFFPHCEQNSKMLKLL